MTKYQFYYEEEGQRINLRKKSRNDFKFVVLHDKYNCGNPSYHTTYESARKRLNWVLFHYPNNLGITKIVEVKNEEI